MKTLLLIPSFAKRNIGEEIAADRHPTMDYLALAAALSSEPEDSVELLDYGSVDREHHPAVQLLARLAGRDAALALMGFLRRHEFDTVFTNSEKLALPLAILFRTVLERPRHVTIAHRLTAKKKQPFYRWLKLYRQMDAIFVYSSAQHTLARQELGIPEKTIRLIPFHADHRFFRPLRDGRERDAQICAAGLERRDYPTMIQAVSTLTDLCVKLAAASPWSKQSNTVDEQALPAHVDSCSYEYIELRDLYAESSFVVVPLYQTDFQAGVTTILEAMAMGKAVIASATTGQTDVIIQDQNGLYVTPGDAEELKAAIGRLREDRALRARLGRAGRRWIEENATLEHWVEAIVAGVRGVDAPQSPRTKRQAAPVAAPAQAEVSLPMSLFAALARQLG